MNLAPTRNAVATALDNARQAVANNAPWLTALNKAAVELEVGRWLWNGRKLVIHSRTTAGQRYTVVNARCECKAAQAGRVCWHKAAYGLVLRASQLQ